MGVKVSFNPVTRIIQVTQAPTLDSGEWVVDLDVATDVYSDGKEDWETYPSLNKLKFPVRYVGGQSLPGSKKLGVTFFLKDGWRIRPYEGDHVFRVNGNLYTETGESPFVPTIGAYNILLTQQVSSLVDSTVQQLAEIEFASFNGGVTVDVINGYPGDSYMGKPVGTAMQPSSNMTDALTIAKSRGLTTFFILGDITLDNSLDLSEYSFYGGSPDKTIITVASNADTERCEFYQCKLTGTLDGDCKVYNAVIEDLNYISGYIELCVLQGAVLLGGGATAHFLDCWAGEALGNPPSIDMGGSGQSLILQNFNGYVKIINKTGTEEVNISLNAGMIELDSTVTNGSGTVVGVGTVTDNSGPGFILDQSRLVSPASVADAVLDEAIADHQISGSAGEALSTIKSVEGGRWKRTGTQMIFYAEDNTTEIARFDLLKADGSPAGENDSVFERTRV